MTGDAGAGQQSRRRRPGGKALVAAAVLLLVGGGTAVVVGVVEQDADPPTPAVLDAAPQAGTPSASGADSRPGTPAPDPTETNAALPVSVSIPAIAVQSDLITVGLNADGTLAVPQPGPDYDKAAWYDGSPRPGEAGPSILEGHVDSAENGPSVFYRLGALVVGDEVAVTREDGSVVTFRVDAVKVFPKDDFPTQEVYGNTEGAELRLITCDGYDRTTRTFDDNYVVYATLTL